MAHKEQIDFCKSVKEKYPLKFKYCSVLDIGSMDINGNNRYLFEDYTYTGIDLAEGPNVDVVGYAHEYKTQYKYDVVISTEALEHDKHWRKTLIYAYKKLKRGGLLLITCATEGRQEHGVKGVNEFCSPHTLDYYKNLTANDILDVFDNDLSQYFKEWDIKEVHDTMDDLYFYAIK